MPKRIIITEEQFREAFPDSFSYIDFENDSQSNDGNVNVSVTGKLSDDEDGMPVTTDDVATALGRTNPFFYGMRGCASRVREDVFYDFNNNGEVNKENSMLNILANGDDSDDISAVPGSVLRRLDILLAQIDRLMPRKKAELFSNMIDSIEWGSIPMEWRKEMYYKILGNVVDTTEPIDQDDSMAASPATAFDKMENLMQFMKSLQPRKKAMILNKMVERIDWTELPMGLRKQIALKIVGQNKSKKNIW